MSTRAINTYTDGSGYWVAYRCCGKWLQRFDWLGRAIWTRHGHEAKVYKDSYDTDHAGGPFSEDGHLRARMLRREPCAEPVRVWLHDFP